ncbi:uncharacterized protein [Drosophila virilis]|uniref:Uncharacterized protein, isoform D n=1 Tax=Drosophila virilis TaxID=7244 RepID=A0A0Q9W4Q9_DROVI|nr:uncharacterized protein LOC6625339 isoform X11 [Drosophila virilis]KRF80105.1 uncharacterized protein Dvir_GJ20211, isoform D [Drosophila virilis]
MDIMEWYYFISFLLILFILLRTYLGPFRHWSSCSRDQAEPDRQNNVELGRQHNRFGDIFYIEPNSQEAARIREQLEKDDKELPSYDEVMRMCNLTTPTAAAALPTPTMESSAIGIAALPAPPYSECDPHLNVETPAATNAVTASTLEPSPSTSRAAQIPT